MPVNKEHIYKSIVEQLRKKCQEMQMYNEQYVQRITKIKKMKRRRKRDVAILRVRLDKFKDNWRAISMKRQLAPHPKRKTEQKRGPKPKVKPPTDTQENPVENQNTLQQQQQVQRIPFHQFQQYSGQIIETDWSGLNEPEPFQLE